MTGSFPVSGSWIEEGEHSKVNLDVFEYVGGRNKLLMQAESIAYREGDQLPDDSEEIEGDGSVRREMGQSTAVVDARSKLFAMAKAAHTRQSV